MSGSSRVVVAAGAALALGGLALAEMYRRLKRAIDEVAAREQIQEFAALYTRGIDRLDPVMLRMPFCEDATMDVPNLDRLEPIMAFSEGATGFLRATLVCSMHNLTNSHVIFDAAMKTAKSEIYFIANHFKKVDDKVVNAAVFGRYCDEWVKKKDGKFYIQKRKLMYDFHDQSWNKTVTAAQTDDNVKSKPVQARKENIGTRDKTDFIYDHLFPELK